MKNKEFFVKNLLKWYEINGREFFWRKKKLDPFQFVVLEIVLQRTTAKRVNKLFDAFFRKYSTIDRIYQSTDFELEADLQVFGLQRRKREIIKKLAKHLKELHDGRLPLNMEELIEIPGIGSYIANAVSCYYGKCAPFLDTNSARVLGRFFGMPISRNPSSDRKLYDFAEQLMPHNNALELNWALIDFGALVCTAKKPRHDICVLNSKCRYIKVLG